MRSLICFAAFAVFFISASASHGDSLSDQQAQGLVTCNHQPTQDFLDFSEELRIQESKESSLSLPPSVSIDTWYHVVAANKTLKGGWVSDESINTVFAFLNAVYRPHGFQFLRKGITRTINAQWSLNVGGHGADPMPKALRKGEGDTLNIYIVLFIADGAVGTESGSPGRTTNRTNSAVNDGCRILSSTLASNGTFATTAHEVGHWLGLAHTFNQVPPNSKAVPNCTVDSGDHIDDTPVHLVGGKCSEETDTCPNQPGRDPVHNFMNYQVPGCRNMFTKGQETRMHSVWRLRTL